MTRVLITGAGGFLGRRLTQALLDRGNLASGCEGEIQPISEIILADLQSIAAGSQSGIEITARPGNLGDTTYLDGLASNGFDTLFHLGSMLTLQTENDPDASFAVNVEALRRLVDKAPNRPKVIFTSSIAIHGGQLPEQVGDNFNPVPATTYGTHKAINELLMADYSRHGRIDGRCLRLPIVLTRPGAPVPAVSDMVAGIIREPLNGVDVEIPIAANTQLPIVSAGAVVRNLIAVHDIHASKLPPKRAFNLPSLTITVAELAAAVTRQGGTGKVTCKPDPKVQQIVDSWPRHFVSKHANDLGIGPDANVAALIADYLEHRND